VVRAARAWCTCSSECAAESEKRSRLVPSGTVGGRIAFTSTPFARSARDASSAASGVPSTTEKIAESRCAGSPSSSSPAAKASMFRHSRSRRPASFRARSTAASAPAHTAAGSAVEKMSGRARLVRS